MRKELDNIKTYINKYQQGYGIVYPEAHVIRLYEKFLKFEMGIDRAEGQRILDFGCGNGTHLEYFLSKGFDVYGIDVIPQAIEQAQKKIPTHKQNLVCIKPGEDISVIFETKFDIIFANQSLYYLSNTDLENTLAQFETILNPNGIVYFTMMGTQCSYYDFSTEVDDMDGLRKVVLDGRLNETSYIGFVHNEEELIKKFQKFKPYFIGYYDCSDRDGSTFHHQFLGLKYG